LKKGSCLFSIIICTKERPKSLRQTLSAFFNQNYSLRLARKTEILVVDSSVRKATKAIFDKFQNKKKFPMRYLYSSKKGISFARNLGVKRARGEFLCFIDDDIEVSQNWLLSLRALIQALGKKEIFYGEILPVDKKTGKKENWIKRLEKITPWVVTSLERSRAAKFSPFTANVCLHRKVFKKIGFFREVFASFEGPVPQPSGEDGDFFIRARKKGASFCFSTKLKVRHLVGRKRGLFGPLLSRYFDDGKNCFLFDLYGREKSCFSGRDLLGSLRNRLILDWGKFFDAFPLGILFFIGNKLGTIVMFFYTWKNWGYYEKFTL
jgi:glycosyltransferase involved in cell wall biosynthesis